MTVDGAKAKIRPDANGAILISIPKGRASVNLIFVETPALRAAQWISQAAWFVLAVLLFLAGNKRFRLSSHIFQNDESVHGL